MDDGQEAVHSGEEEEPERPGNPGSGVGGLVDSIRAEQKELRRAIRIEALFLVVMAVFTGFCVWKAATDSGKWPLFWAGLVGINLYTLVRGWRTLAMDRRTLASYQGMIDALQFP